MGIAYLQGQKDVILPTKENFKLEGYNPHKPIKAKLNT